jgi:chromosome segregation ATPase
MKNQKTLNQQITEFKGKADQFHATINSFEEKRQELESKLVDLSAKLHQRQTDTLIDLSAESLAQDAAIKNEIAETESMLTAVKERQEKLSNQDELNELRRNTFSNAITEAAQKYNDKLPGLLEEIQAAKQQYLNKLVEYRALKSAVNQKIIDVGRQIDREPSQQDFPNVREIAWHYHGHEAADGPKYTVEMWEVNDAVFNGKVK